MKNNKNVIYFEDAINKLKNIKMQQYITDIGEMLIEKHGFTQNEASVEFVALINQILININNGKS